MRNNKSLFAIIDWPLVCIYLVMLFFGCLNIYAANYGEGIDDLMTMSSEPENNFSGLDVLYLDSLIIILDGKFYTTFSYPIYILMICLLIGVLLVGKEIGGAKSWFDLGSFSMQPSEFAKIGALLALSKFLSQLNVNLQKKTTQVKAFLIIALPIVLILLQPDAGSAIVFISLLLVLFREGISSTYLIVSCSAIVLFIITLKFEPQTTMLIVMVMSIILGYLLKKTDNQLSQLLLV